MSANRKTHTEFHPDFGRIPLLPVYSDAEGKAGEISHYRYDPDYEPPLPHGAIRGDIRKQDFCPMCHVPRYFYVDQDKQCVQCDRSFNFTASEQKYWYESLGFWCGSTAIRCPECRHKRRSKRAIGNQLAAAVHALRAEPDDPGVMLELAEVTVRHRETTGSGKLDRAIAAARKAHSLWPDRVDAVYWEAACHALAGRERRAQESFQRFVELASVSGKYRQLLTDAKTRLETGNCE